MPNYIYLEPQGSVQEVVIDQGGILAVISDGTGELVAQIPRAQLQGRTLPTVGQGLKVTQRKRPLAMLRTRRTLKPAHMRMHSRPTISFASAAITDLWPTGHRQTEDASSGRR